MKKIAALLTGAMLTMALSAGVANAYTIDYQYALGNGGFTSNVAGAVVETFDSQSLLWNWVGDYRIRNTPASGVSAQPYGVSSADATNFISVPDRASSGSATATQSSVILGGSFNYFGLWWGSVDTYNSIAFYNNNDFLNPVALITGSQAVNPSAANGNQTAPSTNLYVNIYDLPTFDSFKFISTNYAFEVDNIAVANTAPVPEPSTFLLLGAGLAGAGFMRRRIKK